MRWSEFESRAPLMAARGRELLSGARVAMLATLDEAGWPTISPIEPYFGRGDLVFGAMSWSAKARHLARDTRCTIHTAVTAPDKGEDELKLRGSAVVADPDLRNAIEGGWWRDRPDVEAAVFWFDIEGAVHVGWDLGRGLMKLQAWTPDRGFRESVRPYP